MRLENGKIVLDLHEVQATQYPESFSLSEYAGMRDQNELEGVRIQNELSEMCEGAPFPVDSIATMGQYTLTLMRATFLEKILRKYPDEVFESNPEISGMADSFIEKLINSLPSD